MSEQKYGLRLVEFKGEPRYQKVGGVHCPRG